MFCLSLSKEGIRSSIFSLTSSNSCEAPCKFVHGIDLLNKYLVMLDECVYAAKGRLKGRKPTRRLLRNVEEDLHAIYNPLPLCWQTLSRQYTDYTEGVESTHIDLESRSYSQRQSSLSVAFETWLGFRERSWV